MSIEIDFILEVEVAGKVTKRMIVPCVESYSLPKSPATRLRWSFGDRPNQQKSGYRENRVTLQGSSGYRRRPGFNARGQAVEAKGLELFAEFKKFMDDFERDGARFEGVFGRDEKRAPRLILRMMLEKGTVDHAYYVEVAQFTPSVSPERRMMRTYSLELKTLGAVRVAKDGKFATHARARQAEARVAAAVKAAAPPDWASFGQAATAGAVDGGLLNALPTFEETITLVAPESVPESIDGVQIASLRQIQRDVPTEWAQLTSPIRSFLGFLDSTHEVGDAIRLFRGLPRNVTSDLVDAADIAISSLESAWDAISGPKRAEARPWFDAAYGAIETVRNDAMSYLGFSHGRLPARDPMSSGASIPTQVESVAGVACGTATVIQGETLPQFCRRVLADPDRWPEVVALNDMTSAFQMGDGAPIGADTTLLVPLTDGLPLTPRDLQDLYGTDLLERDGKTVWTGTDFALIRGEANLEQGIRRRITAIRGESDAFPEWGMPPLVGEPGVAGTAAYIAANVAEQMVADPRVQRIENVDVSGAGDTYDVSFDLIPVVGEAIPVVAPVGG